MNMITIKIMIMVNGGSTDNSDNDISRNILIMMQ